MVRKGIQTGIVLLNLGGPGSQMEVHPFLNRLFSDREIIPLPMQGLLGPAIARVRTPKVRKLYSEIGGGSPIRRLSEEMGRALERRLDILSPGSAPHRTYLAFRYADPMSAETLAQMAEDGVQNAVALSQYPQFSCATIGSSLNELGRQMRALGLQNRFKWTVIDRFGTDPGYVQAMATQVRTALDARPDPLSPSVVLYSAHSLPMKVVDRGDPYPQEVAATVEAVAQLAHGDKLPHLLVWQSAVGPSRWLGPHTDEVLEALARRTPKPQVVVVPIAFTGDHIETLHEVDIQFQELAGKLGLPPLIRAPALNAHPEYVESLANLVSQRLSQGPSVSPLYSFKCPACSNPDCRLPL